MPKWIAFFPLPLYALSVQRMFPCTYGHCQTANLCSLSIEDKNVLVPSNSLGMSLLHHLLDFAR